MDKVNKNCIGISENRMNHILGVARKAYQIAKKEGKDEEFCRKMFLTGYLHDVGYEFSEKAYEHPDASASLLYSAFGIDVVNSESYFAIENHGRETDYKTEEWRILNMADMLIDSDGKEVSAQERLIGIKVRYGEESEQYVTAKKIAEIIGLL